MSILRDDRLLALHDLVEACRASARFAELAADLLKDDARARDLEALAAARNDAADRLCAPIIESEDIPAAPPEERGLLDTVLASAKATFAEDGGRALLADCREKEQEVRRLAEAAAAAPLRENEKAIAAELEKDARSRLARLLQA